MSVNRLTTKQLHTLGMSGMSIKARDALMMQIGRTVFASAMVRLLQDLNEEQIYALNYAIEATDSFAATMQYMEDTYPAFIHYLQEAEQEYVRSFTEDLQDSHAS